MTETGGSAGGRLNLELSLQDFLREVRAMRANLDRYVARLDQIEKELTVLLAWLRGAAPVSQFGAGAPHGPVAHSLSAVPLADDSLEVRIDGGRARRFPPRLGEVLLFLAGSEGRVEDELVPWKALPAVAEWLGAKSGRKIRRQYVNGLISLLRAALERAGLDRRLIQTHRRKGVRFALKRTAAKVIGGEWS